MELKHYGVKGMQWGVRRTKTPVSDDSAKVKTIRKKKIDSMTNQELQTANNRMNLERNYRDLTKKKNMGEKVLKGMAAFTLTVSTVAAAYKSSQTVKKAVNSVIDKIGNKIVKDIGRVM